MSELEKRVITCVARALNRDAGEITLETSLVVGEVESLNWVELILELESELGSEFQKGGLADISPDEVRTARDLVEIIRWQMGDDDGAAGSRVPRPWRPKDGGERGAFDQ